ncbi:MAG: hypothetical protein IJ509_00015 [Bacilli bacterium]|nr:hypothetical protein [Bacilli bacterium]
MNSNELKLMVSEEETKKRKKEILVEINKLDNEIKKENYIKFHNNYYSCYDS